MTGDTPEACPVCGAETDHIPSHIRGAHVLTADGEYRCPPTVAIRHQLGLTDIGHGCIRQGDT